MSVTSYNHPAASTRRVSIMLETIHVNARKDIAGLIVMVKSGFYCLNINY